MDPNSYEALHRRRNAATLTWRGPALMLFARSVFAVGAQALVAAIFALRSSLQHAFMPLTFDAKFMAFRLLSSVPNTVFQTLFYLRLRRLVPFAIAHGLIDGASVLMGVLLPLFPAP